jgi:hypothetical protein
MDEGHHRESQQHHHLESGKHVLHPLAGGDATTGDDGRDGQEHQRGGDVDGLVVGEIGDRRLIGEPGDEQIEEFDGDRSQVGQHDDGGHHHAPAAHPADIRPEGLGRPGERRTAFRGNGIQFPVGVCGEEHSG